MSSAAILLYAVAALIVWLTCRDRPADPCPDDLPLPAQNVATGIHYDGANYWLMCTGCRELIPLTTGNGPELTRLALAHKDDHRYGLVAS